jgi:hypothetical protein
LIIFLYHLLQISMSRKKECFMNISGIISKLKICKTWKTHILQN